MQLWNWRGPGLINAHERNATVYARGVREEIGAIETGRLDPFFLLTHIY
ncbi:hypothetical protein [Hoeflea sp. BAL378]|nr:hypothetical protein [Hoeflea sp. BAL378]